MRRISGCNMASLRVCLEVNPTAFRRLLARQICASQRVAVACKDSGQSCGRFIQLTDLLTEVNPRAADRTWPSP